eukprot:g24329.t1
MLQAKWDRFDNDAFLEELGEHSSLDANDATTRPGGAPTVVAKPPAQHLRRYAAEFKILLLGERGVGKTAFLLRHTTGEFAVAPPAGGAPLALRFMTNCGELCFQAPAENGWLRFTFTLDSRADAMRHRSEPALAWAFAAAGLAHFKALPGFCPTSSWLCRQGTSSWWRRVGRRGRGKVGRTLWRTSFGHTSALHLPEVWELRLESPESSFRQASAALVLCDGTRASGRALPRCLRLLKSHCGVVPIVLGLNKSDLGTVSDSVRKARQNCQRTQPLQCFEMSGGAAGGQAGRGPSPGVQKDAAGHSPMSILAKHVFPRGAGAWHEELPALKAHGASGSDVNLEVEDRQQQRSARASGAPATGRMESLSCKSSVLRLSPRFSEELRVQTSAATLKVAPECCRSARVVTEVLAMLQSGEPSVELDGRELWQFLSFCAFSTKSHESMDAMAN